MLCSLWLNNTSKNVEWDSVLQQVPLTQELVTESPKELKHSPEMYASPHPFCFVTVKGEPDEIDRDLPFKTSLKTEEVDVKVEMPDDYIDGNGCGETAPSCASYSLPSSSGGLGEQPTIRNIWTSKDEVIASCFPLSCPWCQSKFENKGQLRRHLHSCTSKGGEDTAPYFCPRCNEVFQNKCEFRSHLYSDHEIKSEEVVFSCSVCNKIYVKRMDFMKHILELHPRVNTHVCPVCKDTFYSCWDLHEHLAKYIDDDSYSCPNCDLTFPTRTALELHMQMEEYTCKTCGLKFHNRFALNHHIRSHTDEIVTCHICYKSYSERLAFAQHISTHSSDIQLKCPKCLKKFASSSSLTSHLRVHGSQHPFACEICNKVFLKRSSLVGHMATHSAARSFTCFICQKSFTTMYDLKRHDVIHRQGKTWTLRRPTT